MLRGPALTSRRAHRYDRLEPTEAHRGLEKQRSEGDVDITLRRVTPADIPECGRILYEAFATLADRHGFPRDFPSVEAATGSMRALISNPGFYGIVAEFDGRVAGSSFLDERSTIHAIGPVSVDPAAQDHHVGRALMVAMLKRARETGTPGVRLVQISYHNRSLSLYAKLGMDVRGTYAAMHGEPIHAAFPGYAVRTATEADEAACNALCLRVHGHTRAGEVGGSIADGKAKVVERLGRISAYTTGVHYFGHSVAETSDDLAALIATADDFGTPGILVPLDNAELFRWCLAHGLRVFFVVNMMAIGLYQEPRGAYLPSVGY
jgi:predicted N-acetyltransferase YhbS